MNLLPPTLPGRYVLNWAAGVSRFYWYAWDNHAWVSIQTTWPDSRTLTPAGQAYGTVQKMAHGNRARMAVKKTQITYGCAASPEMASPSWIIWNPVQIMAERRTFLFPSNLE